MADHGGLVFDTLEQAAGAGYELAECYQSDPPWPHAVIRGLWPESLLEGIEEEFKQDIFHYGHTRYSNKYWLDKPSKIPPISKAVLDLGNSSLFLSFLEALTGICDLHADPLLIGGGMHKHGLGGYLKVHTDFRLHPITGRNRRLNVLLFLNRDWQESWQGNLELWTPKLDRCWTVRPEWNTTVIFDTTTTSFHGLPKPLECPPGVERKSLAWYYYTGNVSLKNAIPTETGWVEVP